MKQHVKSILSTAVCLSLLGGIGAAADLSPEQQEIQLLKERLAVLEQRLNQQAQEKKVEKEKLQEAKKQDWQFGGDARLRYREEGNGSNFDQRFRFTMKKPVDDHGYFFSRWVVMNNNKFGATGDKDNKVNVYNASFHYDDLLQMKGLGIVAGRIGQNFGATQYLLAESTGRMDGVKFTQNAGKGKYTLGYADFSAHSSKIETTADLTTGAVSTKQNAKLGESMFAAVEYMPTKETTFYGSYIKQRAGGTLDDYDYRGIGVKTKVADHLNFLVDYSRNYAVDGNPAGLYASLRYGAAKYEVPKSYEIRFDYRDIEKDNMYGTGLGNVSLPQQGYKGPGISFLYVPIKNTRFAFHQTFNTKNADTGESRDDFTRFDFTWKM